MSGRRRDGTGRRADAKAAPKAKAQRARAAPKRKSRAEPARDSKPKAPPAPPRPAAGPASHAPSAADDFTLALGSAAHELKNGLGPLGMTLQTAERRLLAGETIQAADLSFARAQVRRLAQLVNDLLDVTHLDTDQFPVRARPADLVATVVEALEIFARVNVRHVARVLPAAPVTATFDPERILQVLINLLENAAKYAPLPAAIAVSIEHTHDVARVEIRDGGPGLTGEDQRRLFARFVRARGEGDGRRGLGLGLYLCRSIVERHGGRIGVESTPGGGATFWFELPI